MSELFEKLGRLDRRYFYLIICVVIFVPLARPIGLPVAISDTTTQVWEELQKIRAGDIVMFVCNYAVGASPDVDAGARAMFGYAMEQNAKIIAVTFTPQGDAFAESIIRLWETRGKEYGTDMVNLGYVAGLESAIAVVAADIYSINTDYRGNRVDPSVLPILSGIRTIRDFSVAITINSGNPGAEEWIRQVVEPYGVPVIVGNTSIGAPRVMPFLQAGQVAALLIGFRGAAELEILMERPGAAAAGMDCQSLGHLAIVIFMVLGNIGHQLERRKQIRRRNVG